MSLDLLATVDGPRGCPRLDADDIAGPERLRQWLYGTAGQDLEMSQQSSLIQLRGYRTLGIWLLLLLEVPGSMIGLDRLLRAMLLLTLLNFLRVLLDELLDSLNPVR
jgi:hypothetical protein